MEGWRRFRRFYTDHIVSTRIQVGELKGRKDVLVVRGLDGGDLGLLLSDALGEHGAGGRM